MKNLVFILCLIFLAGCATTQAPLPEGDAQVFYQMNGRYLAMPPETKDQAKAQALSNQYGAVLRFNLEPNSFAYKNKIVADLQTIFESPQNWELLVIPDNTDFMTSIFSFLPEGPVSGNVTLQLEGEGTPALQREIKRLNLVPA